MKGLDVATEDAASQGLADLADAPGYATDPSGRVWKWGHPKRGDIWFPLRSIRELSRAPSAGNFRRTGRRYFPIFSPAGMYRLYWAKPDEGPAQNPIAAEEDYDCPF